MDAVTLTLAKNYTDAVVGGEIPTGQYADISKMFYPNNQYGGIVSSNFNTIAVSGFYTGYGTATGVPDADYSWFVYHHNSNVGVASAYQKAIAYSTELIAYERTKISSTWGDWVLVGSGGGDYTLDNAKLSVVLSGATAETTIEDTDTVPFTDVSVSNSTKKITWANIKATLKTYFDTIYTVISSGSIIADATTLSIELSKYPTIKKTATLTTCTSLTITLPSGANWFDEYILYFTTRAVAPTITLPVGIIWVGGTPTFTANKTYLISIQNGIGVVANV